MCVRTATRQSQCRLQLMCSFDIERSADAARAMRRSLVRVREDSDRTRPSPNMLRVGCCAAHVVHGTASMQQTRPRYHQCRDWQPTKRGRIVNILCARGVVQKGSIHFGGLKKELDRWRAFQVFQVGEASMVHKVRECGHRRAVGPSRPACMTQTTGELVRAQSVHKLRSDRFQFDTTERWRTIFALEQIIEMAIVAAPLRKHVDNAVRIAPKGKWVDEYHSLFMAAEKVKRK